MLDNQPVERARTVERQFKAQHAIQFAQTGRSIDQHDAVPAPGKRACHIRLARGELADQFLDDVFERYQSFDLAAATVKQRASILELTNTRVRNGLESTTAQKNAEVLLALARADRIRADSNLELTRHQIAALIGRGADVYATIREPGLNLDVIPLPPVLPADLLARRADLQAARARIDAALSGRDVARKAFYPDMNIAAFAGWSSWWVSPEGAPKKFGDASGR